MDPGRFRILFRSDEEAEVARKFDLRVKGVTSEGFLIRPRLVSVKVDHVCRSAALTDLSTIKLRDILAADIAKDSTSNVQDV